MKKNFLFIVTISWASFICANNIRVELYSEPYWVDDDYIKVGEIIFPPNIATIETAMLTFNNETFCLPRYYHEYRNDKNYGVAFQDDSIIFFGCSPFSQSVRLNRQVSSKSSDD